MKCPVSMVPHQTVDIGSQMFAHLTERLIRSVVRVVKAYAPEVSLPKAIVSTVIQGHTHDRSIIYIGLEKLQLAVAVVHEFRENPDWK